MRTRSRAAVAGLAAVLLCSTRAAAIEICFAVDGSGSMSASDFTLQLDGLAQAVEDPAVTPQNGSVAISVVQYAGTARVEVDPTVIDSQATADAVAADIRAVSQLTGPTNMAPPIRLCVEQFALLPGERQVIDLSTDGDTDNPGLVLAAADDAVAAGVDAINALGVGPDVNTDFLRELVRPQPASEPPTAGFVVLVPDFDAYGEAIRDKIIAEVGAARLRAPAASAWVLGILSLAMGALGAAALRRRRDGMPRA